jgi:hypothetical protein
LSPPGVPLLGRPDRVERGPGGLSIIDFKSGWSVDDEMRPSHRRQLLLYAYLWHETHGEWPTRGVIQKIDGTRLVLEITPSEACEVAEELLALVAAYNQAVEHSAVWELGSPSDEACKYCDYRPACRRFFETTGPEWEWYTKDLIGEVVSIDSFGVCMRLGMRPIASNVEEPGDMLTILDVPATVAVEIGEVIAISGALPTPVPTDLRVAWQTSMWSWSRQALIH